MRRLPGQALRIGVSGSAVSLLRTSRWRAAGPALTVLAEHAFSPAGEHPFDAIGNALRALLGEQKLAGWPASIVLDDELTRLWQVTPPAGAARLADIEAAAGLRFHTLYGEPPGAWRIAADWDASHPFFAAAVPRALLTVLELVAQEHKLAIVAVTPHFVAAWNRWQRALAPGAWFGALHDGLLTVAAVEGKRLRAVRALPVPAGADHYWLTQALTREALLHQLDAPALLQLCGPAPALWTGPVSNPAHIRCSALDLAQRAGEAAWSSAAMLARCGSAV